VIARTATLLLLLVGVAAAQGRGPLSEPPSPEHLAKVRAIVGEDLWGQMPEWRRRNVVERYQRYRGAPPHVREKLEKRGLKSYLMRTSPRSGKKALPPPVAEAIQGLDPKLHRMAGKLAFVRIRQLRFDRNLALLPEGERRRWFVRLFPEPFDPSEAKVARLEFEKTVARAVATRLKPKLEALEELPREEWRTRSLQLVREFTAKEEQKVIDSVVRQVRRLRGVSAEDAKRKLSGDAALVLEQRNIFATPRQRELIRWALRPDECPLLDFSWMGEKPRAKGARRAWNRDLRVLGRLSLLTDAGLPEDTVLHLASAGSDEDFLRALNDLLGRRDRPERDRPAGARK